MNDAVKPVAAHERRRYNAPRRREAAQATRRAIVAAATRLFVERGYAATTMAAIAEAAGVSHETVYATFGPKPALFRHLVEIALAGMEEPVPALEREIVAQCGPSTSRRGSSTCLRIPFDSCTNVWLPSLRCSALAPRP